MGTYFDDYPQESLQTPLLGWPFLDTPHDGYLSFSSKLYPTHNF